MEFDISNYKKKSEESEASMKDLKQLFETVRSDRNLYSRNLLEAKVSDVLLSNS